MSVVIIIDTSDKTYYDHYVMSSINTAIAFSEGMTAAWKISHGYFNCWRPFVLDLPYEYDEWERMGCPGKEKIQEHLKNINKDSSSNKKKKTFRS